MFIKLNDELIENCITFAIDIYDRDDVEFHVVDVNRIRFSFYDETNELNEYYVNYDSLMHYIEMREFAINSFERKFIERKLRTNHVKQIDVMMHDESYSTRKMSFAHFEIVDANNETSFAIVHCNISQCVTMRCKLYSINEYENYVHS